MRIFGGRAFAQGMGLSSSDFSIQKVGGEFRFLCKGRGHGLGFSQYGGNQLAREGKNWKEILEHIFLQWKLLYMKNKIPGITQMFIY